MSNRYRAMSGRSRFFNPYTYRERRVPASFHQHKRGSEACGRAKTAGTTAGTTASTRTAADRGAAAHTCATAHTCAAT